MNFPIYSKREGRTIALVHAVLAACLLLPADANAQNKRKNPTSKVFVADVSGEAQIDIGESIQDLTKKSVYDAQGTIVEVKKAEKEEDKGKIFTTAVYSNGTGAYYEEGTKIEMKRFAQEPFTPNRTDMDVEPSISQTQAFLTRGTVGLCNSKQVAGSNMTYVTPHGSVNIRGKKVVIEANDDETKISMLEGDSTVRLGATEMGGHVVKTGEQAIIRRATLGAPAQIIVQKIPASELAALGDKAAMACMAKKTVYFDVRENKDAVSLDSNSSNKTGPESSLGDSGTISTFDTNTQTSSSSVSTGEIVAVPVIPNELPISFTVSPATIPTPET